MPLANSDNLCADVRFASKLYLLFTSSDFHLSIIQGLVLPACVEEIAHATGSTQSRNRSAGNEMAAFPAESESSLRKCARSEAPDR